MHGVGALRALGPQPWNSLLNYGFMEGILMIAFPGPAPRHRTIGVKVGGVTVGGGAPIVVQSMTNTDTADADATAKQVAALARAASSIVRITADPAPPHATLPHLTAR